MKPVAQRAVAGPATQGRGGRGARSRGKAQCTTADNESGGDSRG
jgi:hypothetical protein